MTKQFNFSMWTYPTIDFARPCDPDIWAECGLNMPMAHTLEYGKHSPEELLPYLDGCEKHGIKCIVRVIGLTYGDYCKFGRDEYTKRLTEMLNVLRGHPALFGIFVGDEPCLEEHYSACIECIRIQKALAPELHPYLNLHTCMDDTDPALLGGRTFREWLTYAVKEAGLDIFSYGHYDQLWTGNEDGMDSYYRNLRALSAAAQESGAELWNTQLSTAHYMFRIPTEYDFMWQITTAAALGSRGVVWFKFYDRNLDHNAHTSPIDDWGNKTEQFYKLMRCQRRFTEMHGEIIMSLRFKQGYLTDKSYGGYELFGEGCHPIIKNVRGTEQAVVSFFEDDAGVEYLCVVNASQTTPGVFRIDFDRDVTELVELSLNGKSTSSYRHGNTDVHWDGQWLHPGQMCLFRIEKK